jgi:hypothetical protein
MTTNNNSNSDIGISLEHDPELLYWSWKINTENTAANMATIVHPTGLLNDVLSDQEWTDYPANRTTSPGATLTIAPRPTQLQHDPIVGGDDQCANLGCEI